ncbi:MAG: substrate-binding domain-containing protein [Deltaproteobacteria bacterium]|nr:substrate-binding domain-containing protein [Deltaproteobacteria bacterium]
MKSSRHTIALFSDSFLGEYQTIIRTAVENVAREQDLNFQFIVGRELDSPILNYRIQNSLYEQISAERFSGIIVSAGSLSNYCGAERITSFCREFAPIPICSIGIEIPGIPSIVMHNQSFHQLVEHLAVKHGRKRFAYIGGPKSNHEAQTRRSTFLQTLQSLNIPFDPELEIFGDFLLQNGFDAALKLLARQKPFDALVVANDDMAVGALAALKKRDIRVPEEICITGFDDMSEARFALPKLTTMRQPFEQMGKLAVDLLLRQMKGEPVPMLSKLSPQLVVRQSCGCSGITAAPNTQAAPGTPSKLPPTIAQQVQLEAILLSQINISESTYNGWASRLVEALFEELNENNGAFVLALRHIVVQSGNNPWVMDELQNAVSYLRAHFQRDITRYSGDVDNLWHQARMTLFDMLAAQHMEERLALIRANKILVSRSIDPKPDKSSRKRVLEIIIKELHSIGVHNAVVSTFKDDRCKRLECIVAIRHGIHLKDEPMVYPAEWILPDFMHDHSRHSYIVFSLTNGPERLGILALEAGIADNYYEILAEYMSSNLKLLSLYQSQQQQLRQEAKQRQRAMELQHRQKLESLGVLAGGIAHDFNNMLSAMAGNLDIIHLDLPEDHPSMDPLLECRSVVKHATGLVRQLLAYSGKGKLMVTRVELNQLLQDLEKFLRLAVSKNVALKFSLHSNLPPVEADPAQIQQIFVNLVINALEAIESCRGCDDDKRTITIETDVAGLDAQYFTTTISKEPLQAGSYVIARVRDTGSGIDTSLLEQIFDPFFTTKFTGRGLGLAAVLGIIRGHRGSIRIHSEKGKGTTFEIAFPKLASPSEQPKSITSVPPKKGTGTILIADDEPAVLKAGGRLLKTLGYGVLEVGNGQQAIDMVQEFPNVIHCVILDITMPGTGGIAAMCEIAKINPAIPVVLTSGYSEEQAFNRNADVQPAAFLQKPYNRDSLAKLLQQVFSKEN